MTAERSIHAIHADNAYTRATDRLATQCDIIRAIVYAESSRRGYMEGEDDPIADDVAQIANCALSILAERAGMLPAFVTTASNDDLRRTGVRNMLRTIHAASGRIFDRMGLDDSAVAADPRA